MRKLWYNLTITGASVAVALFIGGVEALGLIGRRFELDGAIFTLVESLNASLANLGFAVIGLFALAWLVSIACYRSTFAGETWSRPLSRAESEVAEGADAAEAA
jgi:high-affinity nickel-transport protein